ncbi:AAA domain containing protein [uncultured Caudovirales phage]|uniref:AAA domain containing protein n=1 Tax=uncultured Caudovirales phage TaxID=2100421 RepID=A0A6J5P1U3_9CAUD|nr:AAA domain containing protein [uncultured Caudovirales phage]
MLPIIRGTVRRPQRLVIYAPEGMGKTTLASKLPNPLFLDFEQGTHHLDCARLEPKTLDEVDTILDSLIKDSQGFETLVLDTIDWLEELVTISIIQAANKKSIEDFGYGKGYVMLAERFNDLLAKLNLVAKKMNVVCLAHVHVRKFELPDSAGAFDRYELKLSKQVGPLVREWCDGLLFGNWKTKTREVEGVGGDTKYKALGGRERMLYAGHTAAWDAKNRHALKDEEAWDVATVLKCFGAPVTITVEAKPAAVAAKPNVAKIAAEVKTVAAPVIDTTITAKDDTIPHLAPVEAVEVAGEHALSSIVGKDEAHANAYLLSRNEIKAGQSFRDVSAKYVERCLKSPDAWRNQFMKGVAV